MAGRAADRAAMIAPNSPEDAMCLIARETRTHYGPVPHDLGGVAVPQGQSRFVDGRYLLRSDSGYGYLYNPGEGITIEVPEGGDPDEEGLWLNGSVYCAVASLNGFRPLHASAVAHQGRVYAFTGPSGAGKSTLVAALGAVGLPMFCDDTLVLDLTDPAAIMCMPGHKRLKLTAEALALTGAMAEQPVGADVAKFYARPPAGDVGKPLPLALLVFLEEGPEPDWQAITGAERFARLDDDHYTGELYAAAQRPSRAELFALQARLAGQVEMARLIRPRDASRFAASVQLAAARVLGDGAGDE